MVRGPVLTNEVWKMVLLWLVPVASCSVDGVWTQAGLGLSATPAQV